MKLDLMRRTYFMKMRLVKFVLICSWITLLSIKETNSQRIQTNKYCHMLYDVTKCAYVAHCKDYVTELNFKSIHRRSGLAQYDYGEVRNYDEETVIDCTHEQIYIGGQLFEQIHLVFEDTIKLEFDEIPRTMNLYGQFYPLIVVLDLSGNGYTFSPKLHDIMTNLNSLNMSQNSLTIAKLHSTTKLDRLNDIDFSHNIINTITVEKEHSFENLKKINLSHNYLVEIPDAIFDSFSKLETLDLSHNFIDTLSISTFEGTKSLINLFISNNRLSSISQSLFRFSELQVLDLKNNRIENIKLDDFEKLTKLVNIDLSGNFITRVDQFLFKNKIFLRSLDLHGNKLDFLDKDSFLNTSNIQSVDLSNNNFVKLPKGIFAGKNISHFLINGNNIEGALAKGTFEGLNLVNYLYITNQHLTSLEDYAFLGLDQLTTLFLYENKIEILTKDCFCRLFNLHILDLSNNRITEINFSTKDLIRLDSILLRNNLLTHIKKEYFQDLISLNFLDLSNNKISQLESNSFISLHDLRNFEISKNPLSGILEERTFQGLQSLPSLVITSTEITTIQNGSFTGMIDLKELNMSHSRISDVQFNSFSNTGALEYIDLSFNRLNFFCVNTSDLMNLRTILLNNNDFKIITDESFHNLVYLTSINLSYNNISDISQNAFSDQTDLSSLDVSYNPVLKLNISIIRANTNLNRLLLSGISRNINFIASKHNDLSQVEICNARISNVTLLNLKTLTNLENVILKHNDVVKLEIGAFLNNTHLKNIDLSYNKISFIQPGVFRNNSHLSTLNLSHNKLAEVSYGIFRGLVSLNLLDLSYNNLKSLDTERFYEIHSLTDLIVDHNNIEFFNTEEFAGTNLKRLSIGDNPIPCELFVKFKKTLTSFIITAIEIDESNKENIDGVTCNSNGYVYKPHQNYSEKDNNANILIDIRDTLLKIENNNAHQESHVSKRNDSEVVTKLGEIENIYNTKFSSLLNSSLTLQEETKSTNTLLEKILKYIILARLPSKNISIPKENVTKVDDLIQYINGVKDEMEKVIAIEKKNILEEVDKKISAMTPQITPKMTPEKLSAEKDVKENRSVFTETCVALILIILVCFVLYKFYKSRMFVRASRTYSTRQLPDSMESPDL